MKISAIMPTYNRQDCIWLPLEAMISQTFKNWELFILDDGSSEPYEEYIEMILDDIGTKYKRTEMLDHYVYSLDISTIYLYRLKHHGHPSPVRNFAMDKLTGDLVCFRDDDGYWDATYLEKMSKPFLTKDVIMTYCYRHISRFKSLFEFKRLYNNNFSTTHGLIYNPEHVGGGNFKAGADTGDIMLKTEIFKKTGGFGSPEETGGQEDCVLWKKVLSTYPNGKVVEIGEALNYYIWHQAELPNRTIPKKRGE
jgi:glycosyltransferase involved in cell wall biosynthesis